MEQHFFFQEGLGNGTSKERPSPCWRVLITDDSGSMELEATGPALRPYIMIYFHICISVYQCIYII